MSPARKEDCWILRLKNKKSLFLCLICDIKGIVFKDEKSTSQNMPIWVHKRNNSIIISCTQAGRIIKRSKYVPTIGLIFK